jgi:hypothetical protein
MFDRRKRSAAVDLNATIPWSVEVHGGMSKARASLDRLDLRAFELRGGADRVRLGLGVPTDLVPVRLTGGANIVHIERPADVAIRLRLKGGAVGVVFDEQRLGSATDLVLESPGAGASATRFEVEVTGGANRVTVGRRAA